MNKDAGNLRLQFINAPTNLCRGFMLSNEITLNVVREKLIILFNLIYSKYFCNYQVLEKCFFLNKAVSNLA